MAVRHQAVLMITTTEEQRELAGKRNTELTELEEPRCRAGERSRYVEGTAAGSRDSPENVSFRTIFGKFDMCLTK